MSADRCDELYARFHWNVPQRYNIAQACCGVWEQDRSRFALYWEDESGATAAYTFWDIQREANRPERAGRPGREARRSRGAAAAAAPGVRHRLHGHLPQ